MRPIHQGDAKDERNCHDCDEHQRAVRTMRFKLIRTDAYTPAA